MCIKEAAVHVRTREKLTCFSRARYFIGELAKSV